MIEVLVVLGVIGILSAIMLPAIQRSREAARLTECRDNLRQIAIATESYVEANGIFPQSSMFSMFVTLLPYMESKPLYDQVRFDLDIYDQPPEIHDQRPAWLACPTDYVVGQEKPRVSYAGNLGWPELPPNTTSLRPPYMKVLPWTGIVTFVNHTRPTTPARITDGLSNTALLSEMLPTRMNEVNRAMWLARGGGNLLPVEMLGDACMRASTHIWWDRGFTWVSGGVGTTVYHHVLSPNTRSCEWVYTAASLHDGGVNLALCDGSVRFVSNAVDLRTWRAIGTQSGSEVVVLP